MKLKKKRKSKRMRGHGMGSHGWGARKKHISSGNRGGKGMSGTGKMAGHKKSLVAKLYGGKYFGQQGITSKKVGKEKVKVLNLYNLERDFDSLKKKYGDKEGIINLKDYKILGEGEIKIKAVLKAKAASKSAVEKIEAAGGKVILPEVQAADKEEAEETE